jgi:hypothetical protein
MRGQVFLQGLFFGLTRFYKDNGKPSSPGSFQAL